MAYTVILLVEVLSVDYSKGLVDFVAINCDEDKNKGLCGEYEVRVRKIPTDALRADTNPYIHYVGLPYNKGNS